MAALFHKAAIICLIFPLLLFIQGQAQGIFHFQNPFASQFTGEGFLGGEGQDNRQAKKAGGYSLPQFPFLPPIFYPPSRTSPSPGPPGDNGGVAEGKPATPAKDGDRNHQLDPDEKSDFLTKFKGSWALVVKNSGVSGMHVVLLPNNKLIMYDASAFHISDLKLPNGECLAFVDKRTNKQQKDCWAHGVEFDINTANIRPLKVENDPWCSSGGLALDGTLVGTGGWDNGIKTVRYLKTCNACDFQEYQTALADPRWYSTQITLSDGRFIVVGGRRAYSYEYVPLPGLINTKNQKYKLPLLDQTTDLDENNLYPFVYLSTDGNLFIFANNRSLLLNPTTNSVLRDLPVLDGGARNYPASAMSALLPIRLDLAGNPAGTLAVPAEVIICGGAKHESYGRAGRGTFLPALDDCNRITITDPKPVWKRETMPSRRVMGDMLILPTGDLLMLHGAQSGTAAWFFADKPNLSPILYRPDAAVGERFSVLKAAEIPRMYHSSAAILPDGKILVAGSNTNPGYNYSAKYPTELRVETFSPPYLDPALAKHRPVISGDLTAREILYGVNFPVVFELKRGRLSGDEIKVTIYPPPFTTHGYSMNQRMVVLEKEKVGRVKRGTHRVTVKAPPSGRVAPPGYYLLFVVHRGVPSEGVWVRIT